MQSLTMLCPGRPDLILPIPFGNNSKRILFTLKEGSQYRLKFSFTGSNNIVLGLKYTNVVWKTGMKVDNSKRMLGTFSPQQEPYTCEMEEETTPSSTFARGTYSARTKMLFGRVLLLRNSKELAKTLLRGMVIVCLGPLHVCISRDVKPGNSIFSWKLNKGYLIDFNLAMVELLILLCYHTNDLQSK
uniref:Uncharacterized protein n=1 Tax=Quercus lobata TaxID=97700 RepID=A0A7N2LNK4_QUELO